MKKRFILSLFVVLSLLMVVFALPVLADDYTVALTTFVPTASAGDFVLGAYPNIDNGVRVDKIVISNLGATAQTITLWDTCTSSTTASTCATFSVVATAGEEIVIDYPYYNPLSVRNLGISKSATGSVVHANIQYR